MVVLVRAHFLTLCYDLVALVRQREQFNQAAGRYENEARDVRDVEVSAANQRAQSTSKRFEQVELRSVGRTEDSIRAQA